MEGIRHGVPSISEVYGVCDIKADNGAQFWFIGGMEPSEFGVIFAQDNGSSTDALRGWLGHFDEELIGIAGEAFVLIFLSDGEDSAPCLVSSVALIFIDTESLDALIHSSIHGDLL